jgi:DNA-directed RNA polymerase specialized sigma24 family protein
MQACMSPTGPLERAGQLSEPPGASTMRLVVRARAGDRVALDELFARFGPEPRRFARGPLPHAVRGLVDTPDVVQDALLQTFST